MCAQGYAIPHYILAADVPVKHVRVSQRKNKNGGKMHTTRNAKCSFKETDFLSKMKSLTFLFSG
jgi:hypothetical protein